MSIDDSERLLRLLGNSTEGLSLEFKAWLRPKVPRELAKIVKACIAMRNNGGGVLAIGIDNNSRLPIPNPEGVDVRAMYSPDYLQQEIGRHASESFEIALTFVDGMPGATGPIPVIKIPGDVRSPVAIRRPLLDSDGTILLKEHAVYCRSLQANKVASTTEARWNDWGRIVETCIETREVDASRFIRRHLVGRLAIVSPGIAVTEPESRAAIGPSEGVRNEAVYLSREVDRAQEVMQRQSARLRERLADENERSAWRVAAVVDERSVANRNCDEAFLREMMAVNPRLTGWPPWVDSSGASEAAARPKYYHDTFEALIVRETSWGPDADFWSISPRGSFFHWRQLEDDLRPTDRGIQPNTVLDFALVVLRTAEAVAVALHFARTLVEAERLSSSALAVAFRWNGLANRTLSSWASQGRYISPGRESFQNDVEVSRELPLDVPDDVLPSHVEALVAPVFRVFNGFVLSTRVIEDLVGRLLQRRLGL